MQETEATATELYLNPSGLIFNKQVRPHISK